MSFASIAIKTSIPVTAPAATSGALTFITIEDENWLQITGDASAGSGSLYVLRWNADLAEWRPYMEDKPIAVNSATLNGLFSAYYPFPKGEESFCLYDPASAITATASAARTGSPLAAPTPASSGASGGATEAKQDAGNASLVSILGQLDNKTSTLATASAQTTGNSSLSSIDGKVATAAKQDTGNTSLSSIDSKVATAANQTTANSSLASILAQLDSKTSTLATEATISAIKTLLGAGLPAALVGGKLDVNLGTSSITLSVSGPLTDAQLRASSVSVSQGGSSFTWFSTATGSLLKTGAGVVRRIIIGSNVAGTVTLHDNTSAAGTVITSVTSTTSTPCNQVELGVAFSTGLYCTTTGSGISVTVVYD